MTPDPEIGRYRLQRQLQEDSQAWLAEDLEDPTEPVAVKILPAGSDLIAARHLKDTLSSADAQQLSLPIDQGELADGRPFVVFALAEGPTLREVLNSSGPLPFGLAGTIIRQISAGIAALHAIRVTYGILSPEHVIVQTVHGKPHVILLSPGVYRITGETSASPAYLAPEQLSGQAVPASDIFSLGVLAAEILTGRRAFRYGSLDELRRLQRIGLARGALRKLRPKIPLRVEDDVRRATAWDVAHRPSDAEVLGARIAETLGYSGLFGRRRLILGSLLAVALAAAGLRRCRR